MSSQMLWVSDYLICAAFCLLGALLGKIFPQQMIPKRIWYRLNDEKTAIYLRFCIWNELYGALCLLLAAAVIFFTKIDPWTVTAVLVIFIVLYGIYARHWSKHFLGELF